AHGAPVVLRPHTRSSLSSAAYGVSCRARGGGRGPLADRSNLATAADQRPIRPNRTRAPDAHGPRQLGPPLALALCGRDSAGGTTVRMLTADPDGCRGFEWGFLPVPIGTNPAGPA